MTNLFSRRELLHASGMGAGSLALASLLPAADILQAAPRSRGDSPLADREPHFPARAKRMIMLGNLEPAETLLNWGFLDELVAAGTKAV